MAFNKKIHLNLFLCALSTLSTFSACLSVYAFRAQGNNAEENGLNNQLIRLDDGEDNYYTDIQIANDHSKVESDEAEHDYEPNEQECEDTLYDSTFESINTTQFSESAVFSNLNERAIEIVSDASLTDGGTSDMKPTKIENKDSFLFFTDPHLFAPFSGTDINDQWFQYYIPAFKKASLDNNCPSIVCGGDLLNHGDSRKNAFDKLKYFSDKMNEAFDDFYFVVGNHDTNYQGDTYIQNKDSVSCRLSQEEMQDALFGGESSYYYFDSQVTRHYCFDSGIDWDGNVITPHRRNQIMWFAEDLIGNKKRHITIFIHITYLDSRQQYFTAFLNEIGSVIKAYNEKVDNYTFCGEKFDYSKTKGHIDFIQSGHEHIDINDRFCAGVPVITTRLFACGIPTFDYVYVDYDESVVKCKRYGAGQDRVFNI